MSADIADLPAAELLVPPQHPADTGSADTAPADASSREEQARELWALLESMPATHPARLDARNRLVDLHMPLARHLAQRYRNRGESLDDLLQVAAVGLIKAVDRFEPSRGLAFSTFAMPTILGEIKRHFRDKTWMVRLPRSLQELRGRLNTAREELGQQLGRSPTVAELAEFMGLTEDAVLEGLEAANAYAAVSIDTPDDGDSTVGAAIERQLGITDEGLDLVERRQCVTPLLDSLPERDRQIIFLRFFREMTQVEIASELGISQMHVSRLLTRTLARLHRDLQDAVAS
jgi:RNA polymerase sigma-B factor